MSNRKFTLLKASPSHASNTSLDQRNILEVVKLELGKFFVIDFPKLWELKLLKDEMLPTSEFTHVLGIPFLLENFTLPGPSLHGTTLAASR